MSINAQCISSILIITPLYLRLQSTFGRRPPASALPGGNRVPDASTSIASAVSTLPVGLFCHVFHQLTRCIVSIVSSAAIEPCKHFPYLPHSPVTRCPDILAHYMYKENTHNTICRFGIFMFGPSLSWQRIVSPHQKLSRCLFTCAPALLHSQGRWVGSLCRHCSSSPSPKSAAC